MKVAYIKPTNYCNIGCDHCFLSEDVRADQTTMSAETLSNSALLLSGLVTAEPSTRNGLHVIWHGGEPMSLPVSWYRDAQAILDKIIGYTNYSESIQTSLIPFTERWVDLIHDRFSGHIGSSIDFGHRTIKGSAERYIDLWLKKVALARAHGISVTPCVVPGRQQIRNARKLLDFCNEHRFDRVMIERYTNYGISTIEFPTNAEHADFLISLFDEVVHDIRNNKKPPIFNVISAAVRGVAFGKPGDRWGSSCQRDFVVIEPDGSINSCPDRTSYDVPFSNAHDGIDALLRSEGRRKWIRVQAISHKKDHCMSCEFNSWCKSGCPITPNGPSENQVECSGYKTYLLHVKKFLTSQENVNLMNSYMGLSCQAT